MGEGEPQRTFRNTHSAVDTGGGRSRLLIGLETNIVEQGGFGERLLRDRRGMGYTHPPAQKMEQIVRIAARNVVSATPRTSADQKAVAPFHLPAIGLY